MFDTIEIDGNDGVGKTTVCERLRTKYTKVTVRDRGKMTEATEDPSVEPDPDVVYVLLDAPVDVSRKRLKEAGKDLDEQYHTEADLREYKARFQDVARRFEAEVIDADKTVDEVVEAIDDAIGCEWCGSTGRVIEVIMEQEGMVQCPDCNGTGITKDKK